MKSRKEILIETLHGSLVPMDKLPEMIDDETIYDENGYVDCEFFTAVLEWMAKMTQTMINVQRSVNRLLGVEEIEQGSKKGKDDAGSKWSVEEILRHCTLEDNVMKLPQVQFNKKSYAEAKKWIEEAGGNWQGGKVQGFTFPFNPERIFGILHEGRRCNLQQEFQFFATPAEVADWLVMLAGGVQKDEKVLEPSAGRGAIVDAIHRSCKDVVVDCLELMPENKEILSKKENVRVLGDDFMDVDLCRYNKIFANPPFSKNQDIRHVRRMYDLLLPGGTVASVMGCHWKHAGERECVEFRQWLGDVGAQVYDIDEGSFMESGTGIAATAVVIVNNQG